MSSNPFAKYVYASGSTCKSVKTECTHVKVEVSEDESICRKQLDSIIDFRRENHAPVDQFGTQACPTKEAQAENGSIYRFQLLVGSLLSSQTKDPVTHAAMMRLHEHCSEQYGSAIGLTVPSVLQMNEQTLDELLIPTGFHRRKAKHIKEVAMMLHKYYRNDIPRGRSELEELPGIGPKIARVIMLLAWEEADGIVVDTHVHRVAQRLHWVGRNVKLPEDTRKELQEWVPRSYWDSISYAVVGLGQTVCVANRPKCSVCPVGETCPSAQVPRDGPEKKKKKE